MAREVGRRGELVGPFAQSGQGDGERAVAAGGQGLDGGGVPPGAVAGAGDEDDGRDAGHGASLVRGRAEVEDLLVLRDQKPAMMASVQLHQLEYLVAVVDEGGFTRAAERLRVAQPGVSAQVRKLERELGHALLDRSGHQVRPTPVGVEVVAAAAGRPGRGGRGAAGGRRPRRPAPRERPARDGQLGAVPRRARGRRRLLRRAPARRVLAGGAGVGGAGGRDCGPGGWTWRCWVRRARCPRSSRGGPSPRSHWCVAVPPDHPLAAASVAGPADLAGRDLVLPAEGNALRDAVELACAAVSPAPRVTCSASDPTVLARLAARGLGRRGAAGVGVGAAERGARDGAVRGRGGPVAAGAGVAARGGESGGGGAA